MPLFSWLPLLPLFSPCHLRWWCWCFRCRCCLRCWFLICCHAAYLRLLIIFFAALFMLAAWFCWAFLSIAFIFFHFFLRHAADIFAAAMPRRCHFAVRYFADYLLCYAADYLRLIRCLSLILPCLHADACHCHDADAAALRWFSLSLIAMLRLFFFVYFSLFDAMLPPALLFFRLRFRFRGAALIFSRLSHAASHYFHCHCASLSLLIILLLLPLLIHYAITHTCHNTPLILIIRHCVITGFIASIISLISSIYHCQ